MNTTDDVKVRAEAAISNGAVNHDLLRALLDALARAKSAALREARLYCPVCGGAGYIPGDDETETPEHKCPERCDGAAITQEWLDGFVDRHTQIAADHFITARDEADRAFSGPSGGQWALVFLAELGITVTHPTASADRIDPTEGGDRG